MVMVALRGGLDGCSCEGQRGGVINGGVKRDLAHHGGGKGFCKNCTWHVEFDLNMTFEFITLVKGLYENT